MATPTVTASLPDDASAGPLFLGLDISTQSTKASLLTSSLHLLSELSVNFDRDLPHYGTTGGVHVHPSQDGDAGAGQEINSPALMAVESLDVLADRIKAANWPTGRIKAVSAAGQQHASVYWSRAAPSALAAASDPNKRLVDQLGPSTFSRQQVPNWQDSSTTAECRAFESHVGGAAQLAKLTGSRAYERFTGPQIMRFRKREPQAYEDTERVGLVSSLVTTLLCLDGEIKGIDESDACGMNLWDLSTPQRGWSRPLLELVASDDGDAAAAGELARKLGRVESDGGRIVGRIGSWWQHKLGFSPDCIVCPATGDNPATLLALALGEREAMVSLGTSDTLLIPAPSFEPSEAFHVFYHPARVAGRNATEEEEEGQKRAGSGAGGDVIATSSRYFNMLVYKNGSLAREMVRDRYAQSSWERFDEAVRASWPSSSSRPPSKTGFYWFKDEIIPPNAKGVHLYAAAAEKEGGSWSRVEDFTDPSADHHPGAIIASQLLSFKSRVGSILHSNDASSSSSSSTGLARVHATGGASSNQTLLETMSDVLSCDVVRPQQQGNACSVGAALKARWAWERANVAGRDKVPFDVCVEEARGGGAAAGGKGEMMVQTVARPDEGRAEAWGRFLPVWEELEGRAVRGE